MGWKPEVFVEGKWSQNALVFATEKEANDSAYDLFCRWTAPSDYRAVEVADAEPNYTYGSLGLQVIKKEEANADQG